MNQKQFRKITSEIELLKSKLDFKNKIVVDVGCGVGKISRLIANEGAIVYGIDIPELISKALYPGDNENVIFKNGTGQKMPVESNSADIVIFLASYHHIPLNEMQKAIDECYRVLKKDGVVCFIEPFPQKGSYYELIRLVEDEAEIQKQAYQRILSIDQQKFQPIDESYYFLERTFNDYTNLINIYVQDLELKDKIISRAKEIIELKGLSVIDAKFKSFVRMNIIRKHTNGRLLRT